MPYFHLGVSGFALSQLVSCRDLVVPSLISAPELEKPVVYTKTCYKNKAAKHGKITVAQMNISGFLPLNLSVSFFLGL